jgi:transposase
MAWHKSNPVSQRLASVPGIGPIIATAIAATALTFFQRHLQQKLQLRPFRSFF